MIWMDFAAINRTALVHLLSPQRSKPDTRNLRSSA